MSARPYVEVVTLRRKRCGLRYQIAMSEPMRDPRIVALMSFEGDAHNFAMDIAKRLARQYRKEVIFRQPDGTPSIVRQ